VRCASSPAARSTSTRRVLLDPDDWSDRAAEELARESGIERLDAVQWRVLRFLRAYYLDQGRAPLNRDLKPARS